MSHLPCTNQSCRSYGRPHPNCRCHDGYAQGGEVEPFCAQSRTHRPECEYFADGGMVADAPPAFDDMPADHAAVPSFDELPSDQGPPAFDTMPSDQETYGAPEQQALGAVEGGMQGVLGPVAPWLVKHGVYLMPQAEEMTSYAAQKARQDQNPITHGVSEGVTAAGSMLTGVGEAGMAASAASKVGELAGLGKAGAMALKGMVTNGVIQAGDEVSKWMLGQGDPHDAAGAAMHVGAAALFGLIPSAVSKAASNRVGSTIEKIAESKVGAKIADFLTGFGEAASGVAGREAPAAETLADQYWRSSAPEAGAAATNAYKAGRKAFDSVMGKGISKATKAASGAIGTYVGAGAGPLAAVAGHATGEAVSGPIAGMLEKIAGPAAKKYIGPATLKILSSGNTAGILDALNHAEKMAAGADAVGRGLDSLFTGASNAAISGYGSEKDRQRLDDYIGNGGIDQNIQQQIFDDNANAAPPAQGFAEGGDVKKPAPPRGDVQPILKENDGVAMHYPEHNIAMSAAKGRISGYLRGLRPSEHAARLAFDDAPDTREQQKTYHRALDVANAPLGILKDIADGTAEPEHIKHLTSMYPELVGLLQKKATERVIQSQLDGKKPSYKVRQGLSMLLGTALSSELTPQGIQAAQATFAARPAPQDGDAGAAKPKKGGTSLTKSDQAYLTGSQALVKRQQRT